MAYPIIARYFLRFRHSDTNLLPTFTFIKRSDTMADLTPGQIPVIQEVGGGVYYFQWAWQAKTDPDITFEVDGGPSIPTEEVRYISDVISVRDYLALAGGGGSGGTGSGGGAAWSVG